MKNHVSANLKCAFSELIIIIAFDCARLMASRFHPGYNRYRDTFYVWVEIKNMQDQMQFKI